MSAKYGQLILHALETLGQPATLKDVVSTVAKSSGMTADEVRETVKLTLSGGVKHGYVKFSNSKYSVEKHDAKEGDDAETIPKTDEEPKDASQGRRRRLGSSHRRQPSVSRRSRSRRNRSRQSRSRRSHSRQSHSRRRTSKS